MWSSCTRVRCHTSQAIVLAPGSGGSTSVSRSSPSTASRASAGIRPNDSSSSAATSIASLLEHQGQATVDDEDVPGRVAVADETDDSFGAVLRGAGAVQRRERLDPLVL